MTSSIVVKKGGGVSKKKITKKGGDIIRLKSTGECSISKIDGTPTCAKPSIIKKVGGVIGIKTEDVKEIVEVAKTQMKCDTEKCVLKKVVDVATPELATEIKIALKEDFKPIGPADSTALLSNVDIDGIMDQMAKKFNTLAMPFHMINFDTFNGGQTELNKINLADEIAKGVKTFSVVLNTDKYENGGIHWFCLFGDFRTKGTPDDPYVLEYFNSSGDHPRSSVAEWLAKQKSLILASGASVIVKDKMPIAHQQGDTECGVYSLYYLISRIKNEKDREFFETVEIPDDAMTEFRQSLFALS